MEYTYNMSGRDFTVEVDKFAKQANGSVLVRYGDTVLLVTATASKEPREGIDFPLTVDYEERMLCGQDRVLSNGRVAPLKKLSWQQDLPTGRCARCFPKGFAMLSISFPQ